ncbi:MAG: type II toxin-antitoxin system HicA family toxin [Acutalibacteraceae bacterium]|nr:type II toxin-antitoxin system HicA family toxin [Acutalibacteraceae bacterium]
MIKTKRTDLIKLLERNGWYLKRNGGNHDLYTNGKQTETIPRHKEIKENLAKVIIKRAGLK